MKKPQFSVNADIHVCRLRDGRFRVRVQHASEDGGETTHVWETGMLVATFIEIAGYVYAWLAQQHLEGT